MMIGSWRCVVGLGVAAISVACDGVWTVICDA